MTSKEEANALIADLIIEAEYGATSGDQMLARSSRGTLAIASILRMILTGDDINEPVDNSMSASVDDLVKRVTAIEENAHDASNVAASMNDSVHAIDNRLSSIEAKFGVLEANNADVGNADADIAARLSNETAKPVDVPAINADQAATENTSVDANVETAARVDTPAL